MTRAIVRRAESIGPTPTGRDDARVEGAR
jgi:hypothetical protein